MQISCPSCSAQYNVDEARIPPQGVSIKCPRCQHQFVVPSPSAAADVPLPGAGAVPLPGAGGAVPLPGSGGAGAVPLPGAGGAGAVPLPGSGAVPLPGSGGAGAVPLPGAGGAGAVPLPGSGGAGAVPLPGMGGSVPLPGAGSAPGAVPLPGMGGGVPLPGMGAPAGVPLPGAQASVPLPGVPLPGVPAPAPVGAPVGSRSTAMADIFDDNDDAPLPAPVSQRQSSSMADIFGDNDSNEAPLPTPFHGNNSVVVNTNNGMNSLLDFIDDAGKADAAPKQEAYKIRKRSGRVLGPFDTAAVLQMFARGELLGSEEASTDGVAWRPLAQIPAFSETIQKAMAQALGGLDNLPTPKRQTTSGDLAVGTEDLHKAEKAKEGVERRRRDKADSRSSAMMAFGAFFFVALLVGVAGVAAEFASPYGWFFHKLIKPPTEQPINEPVKVVEKPPPPPTYGDEVPAKELFRRGTYAAYAQGAEQAKRIVQARKALTPFPEDGKLAAAEQAHFLAYLVVVEDTPAFLPELQAALALASVDEIGIAIGKTAVAYANRKWDDGIAIITPLTDPARSFPGPTLAEVEMWLALGLRGKGDLEGAIKHVDIALQADMTSLFALSHQAILTQASGDIESAKDYMEKVFALSPMHPRTKILQGTLLAAASATVDEGKEILVDMSEGKGKEAASPAQQATAYLERANIAIAARAYPEAMRLLGDAIALVPQNRTFRARAIDFSIRLREYAAAAEHSKALLELSPDDSAGIIGAARAKMGTKLTLAAYTELQQALKTNPDDAALNFWFGVAAKEMGKADEARAQFVKAQKLDPKAADPVVENVLAAIERGKLGEALKLADEAIDGVATGERYRVRATKAYVYTRQRQFEKAEADYTRALNENPRDSDTRAHFAEALVQMKKLGEAEKQVNEALLMDGKNPSVLLAAGDVAVARNELKQGLDRYEEAMQLAPNNYEPYARAAVIAARLKDPQRARGLAETAGQLRPANPDVIVAQALVMEVTDPKQAASLLTQAAEGAPEDPLMPYLLGRIYQSMSASLEAIDALKRAVTLAKNYDDAWFVLGKVNRDLGRNDEARRAFMEVTTIDKTRPDAWVEIADILANRGDDAGALAAYEAALKADPQNPESVCAMGETLILRMGEDQKSLKRGVDTLERCVKLNRTHPSAWKNLGNGYRTLNKRKEALAAYKQHVAVSPTDPETSIVRDYIVDLGGKP